MNMTSLHHTRIIDHQESSSQAWKLLPKQVNQNKNKPKFIAYNNSKNNQIHLSILDMEKAIIHPPMRSQSQNIS